MTTEIAHNVSEAAKGTAEVAEKIVDVIAAPRDRRASGRCWVSARALSDQSGHLKAEVEKFLNTVRAA